MNSFNEILLVLNEKEIDFKIGNLESFFKDKPQKYFNHDIAIKTYKV